MKYRVYCYEVWGNEEDGYEVNNVFGTDMIVDIGLDDTKEAILAKLGVKESEFDDYGMDWDGASFIWFNYRDVPAGELRPEDTED